MILIDGLTRKYAGKRVVCGLDLRVERGALSLWCRA